jgi:hypothetical protein
VVLVSFLVLVPSQLLILPPHFCLFVYPGYSSQVHVLLSFSIPVSLFIERI